MKIKRSLPTLFPLFFFLLTACPSKNIIPKQAEITNQEDIGSIHVTVFPPIAFEKYKNRLSPKFTLSGDAALDKVAPYTVSRNAGSLSRISGELSVGLPTMESSKTITNNLSNGTASQDIESKEVQKSGTVPERYESGDGGKQLELSEKPGDALKILDPMTQYWSAAALYQEVQLLNHFIEDIDPGSDYRAYVVRLQISQMPYVRRAGYDSIVDLSFFVEGKNLNSEITSMPIVLPMLVTDNLESAQTAYHTETVRDLALSLKGMAGEVGFNVGGEVYRQLISDILGRDLNSLLTVGRLHDNILRVRLGAQQQGGGIYSVIPHTQTVSVVLLAKKDAWDEAGKLVVTSHTQWKNTLHPEKKLNTSYENVTSYAGAFNEFITKLGYNAASNDQYNSLARAYENNSIQKFASVMTEIGAKAVSDKECATKLRELQQNKNYYIELLKKYNKCVLSEQEKYSKKENEYKEKLRKFMVAKQKDFTENPISNGTKSIIILNPNAPGADKPVLPPLDSDCEALLSWDFSVSNQLVNTNVKIIWGMFASLIAESSYDKTSVDFPHPPKKPVLAATGILTSSTPLYLFDNEKKMIITIPTLGSKRASYIYGKCEFAYTVMDEETEKVVEKTFPLFSVTTDPDPVSNGIKLTFPSALALGYKSMEPSNLSLYWNMESEVSEIGTFTTINHVIPSTKITLQSKVLITDNLKSIAIDKKNNKGTVRFFVGKRVEKDLVLYVAGARLESSSDKSVAKVNKNALSIKDIGSFTITLANLVAGEEVSFTLSSKKQGLSRTIGTLIAK